MVGLLGVALAGGARGARDVSNRNVEVEREALRERYATQYKEFEYQRGREAQREDAAAAGAAEESKYQRGREDKISDREAEQEFKAGESEKERSSRYSIAALRAKSKEGGAGGKESKEGVRSAIGKQINDLIDNGLASDPEEAWDRLVKKGLIHGVAANEFLDSPRAVFDFLDRIGKEREISREKRRNPQNTYLDYDKATGFK